MSTQVNTAWGAQFFVLCIYAHNVSVCVCVGAMSMCMYMCGLDGFHLTLPALKVHLDSCLQSPSHRRCGNGARPN